MCISNARATTKIVCFFFFFFERPVNDMLREEIESQNPQLKLEKRKSTGDKQRTNSTFKKQLKTC